MKSAAPEIVRESITPSRTIGSSEGISQQPTLPQRSSRLSATVLEASCVASLLVILSTCFSKTILIGQSVSRIALLPEWDSLFHSFRQGTSSLYDPSLIQLFAPSYFLVAKLFQKGYLPLWNPYSGFGAPLTGDIQSSAFSPLRILFNLNPSIQMWNWMLFGELALCAVSTYALARFLRLERIPSLFAALMYTFCPFNFWYLELNLGSASCIFPLTFLLFARAARLQTTTSYVLAGAGSAFLILSGHPESAFFGITFGSFLMFCMIQLDASRTLGDLTRFFIFCRGLMIAGISALALTAPVLFPFVEYLANSETYKYTSVCSAHVPWPGIVQHLLNPSSGAASPFTGIVTAMFIPLALLAPFRKTSKSRTESLSLLILAIVAFLLTSQLGQLEYLFMHPPLTTIITRYCLPVLLLVCPLLAAFGLSELFREEDKSPGKHTAGSDDPEAISTSTFAAIAPDHAGKPGGYGSSTSFPGTDLASALASKSRALPLKLLACSTLAALSIPWLLQHNADWFRLCSFDLMLPAPAFNSIAWKKDVICAVVVLVLATLSCVLRNRLPKALIASLVLIPAFISVASVARNSLPKQPSFNYPLVAPLAELQDPNWRTVSTSEHIFRAGTNAVYGIQDVQVHNPLFPRRYLNLIKACGARVDLFNQNFETSISPLLSVTSARYLLSQLPVSLKGVKEPAAQCVVDGKTAINFSNHLVLDSATLSSRGTAASGDLNWRQIPQAERPKLNPDEESPYTYAPVLFDARGNVIWFGDQTPVKTSQHFQLPVPPELVAKQEQLTFGLQVFDKNTNEFIVPSQCTEVEHKNKTVNIATFTPEADTTVDNLQPRLLKEETGHIRLYENPRAMPRAYVVYQSKLVLGAEQALTYLKSAKFAPHREAIIEPNGTTVDHNSDSQQDDLLKLAIAQAAQENKTAEKVHNGKMLNEARSDATHLPPVTPALTERTSDSSGVDSTTAPLALPVPPSNLDLDAFTLAKLDQRGPNEVHTRFTASAPGFLVLTDVFYPGWKAFLDGVETPILRANYAFRAVRVPQGAHSVVFRYEPLSFTLGVCCFILFVLGSMVAAIRSYFSPAKR